jgi:hypothetical protein
MPNESRKKLYNAISSQFDLGSFEEFDTKMNDKTSREKLYKAVSQSFDLGSFDEFDTKISTTATPPPQAPTGPQRETPQPRNKVAEMLNQPKAVDRLKQVVPTSEVASGTKKPKEILTEDVKAFKESEANEMAYQKVTKKATDQNIGTKELFKRESDNLAQFLTDDNKVEFDYYKQIDDASKRVNELTARTEATGNPITQADLQKAKFDKFKAQQQLLKYEKGVTALIDNEIANLEKIISTSANQKPELINSLKESVEKLKQQRENPNYLRNPDEQIKQIYSQVGGEIDTFKVPGATPREKIQNYALILKQQLDDLETKIREIDPNAPLDQPTFTSGYDLARQNPQLDVLRERRMNLIPKLQVVAPIALINKMPTKDNDWFGSSFTKAVKAELLPDKFTKQNIADMSDNEVSEFIYNNNVITNLAENDLTQTAISKSKELGAPVKAFSGNWWGNLAGTSASMIPAFALGSGAVSGVSTLAKIPSVLNMTRRLYRVSNIARTMQLGKYVVPTLKSAGKGVEYMAAEPFLNQEDLKDEASFLSGFLGQAVAGPMGRALSGKNVGNLVSFLFKENAPDAAKLITTLGNRVSSGLGEYGEEVGNTIGPLLETYISSGNFQNLKKDLYENFGTLDANMELFVGSTVMGMAMGSGTGLGVAYIQNSKNIYNQLPPEQQEKADAIANALKNDVEKAEVQAKKEEIQEGAEPLAEDILTEEDKQKKTEAIEKLNNPASTVAEKVEAGRVLNDIKIKEHNANITEKALEESEIEAKLDLLRENFIKNGKTEKEADSLALQSITEQERQVLRGSYQKGREGSLLPKTDKSLMDKQLEAEAKIERKDLFADGGTFSNILGGSGVNSVPTSHKKINGIEFVEFSNPNTGEVDVIMTGTSDADFVGFYRIYENGKPTNKWSSKFENQSRDKNNFKTMISGAQNMLPKGHEYTEKTSISTDGLRVWEQQLSRGYDLQFDKNGKLITSEVAINGDAIVNELGIDVKKGDFENISVTTKEQFEKVKKALLPYLEKFGLNESNIRNVNGTVEIDLPVLKSKSESTSAKEQSTQSEQSSTQTSEQSDVAKIEAKLDKLKETFLGNGKTEAESDRLALMSITEQERQVLRDSYNADRNTTQPQATEEIVETPPSEVVSEEVITPKEEVGEVKVEDIKAKKYRDKKEVAEDFKSLTGDNIEIAKTKLGGFALRENMRKNGAKVTIQNEKPPYTDEQIKLIDVYDGFAKKSPYMFHTTLPNNILSIQKEGLVVGKKPRFEGVSSSDKISLAANEEIAKYYGEETDVLLRVKKGYIFKDLEIDLLGGGDGAYTTGKNIPPDALEVKSGKKWVPLKDYKPNEQTTPSKEQAKEVVKEQPKKAPAKKKPLTKQEKETIIKNRLLDRLSAYNKLSAYQQKTKGPSAEIVDIIGTASKYGFTIKDANVLKPNRTKKYELFKDGKRVGKSQTKSNIPEATPEQVKVAEKLIDKDLVTAWNGDQTAPRLDANTYGISWQEIRQGEKDIKAGKTNSAPAKKLIQVLNQIESDGEVNMVVGSGGAAVKMGYRLSEARQAMKEIPELTDSDMEEINANLDTLAKEYEEWFAASLTEQEQNNILEENESRNQSEISENAEVRQGETNVSNEKEGTEGKGEEVGNPALANVEATAKALEGEEKNIKGIKKFFNTVYHATKGKFKDFSENFLGSNTKAKSAQEGFFFASNKDVSVSYASKANDVFEKLQKEMEESEALMQDKVGMSLYDYKTTILRKYRFTPEETVKIEANKALIERTQKAFDTFNEYKLSYDFEPVWTPNEISEEGELKEVVLDIKNPFIYDQKGEPYRDKTFVDVIKEAKEKGHDGVIIKNTYDGNNPFTREMPTDVHIVFKPSQIKDANQAISEAYHKAKADDSNPELVKAVEDLLSEQPTKKSKPSKKEIQELSSIGVTNFNLPNLVEEVKQMSKTEFVAKKGSEFESKEQAESYWEDTRNGIFNKEVSDLKNTIDIEVRKSRNDLGSFKVGSGKMWTAMGKLMGLYVKKGVTSFGDFIQATGYKATSAMKGLWDSIRGRKSTIKLSTKNANIRNINARLFYTEALDGIPSTDDAQVILDALKDTIDVYKTMSIHAAKNDVQDINNATDALTDLYVELSSDLETVKKKIAEELELGQKVFEAERKLSVSEKLAEFFADDFRWQEKMQKEIEKTKGTLPDDMNPYIQKDIAIGRMADTVNRVYQKIFGKTYGEMATNKKGTEGMVQRMAKDKLNITDLDFFMMVQHAKERNARVKAMMQMEKDVEVQNLQDELTALQNANQLGLPGVTSNTALIIKKQKELAAAQAKEVPDAGSGMTDAEADNFMKEFEKAGKKDKLEAYAKEFRETVIQKSIDLREEAGDLSPEEAEALRTGKDEVTGVDFEFYIPLKVKQEALPDKVTSSGRGGARFEPIQKIKGTNKYDYTKRISPVTQSLLDFQASVKLSEDNKVAQSLYNLVKENPNKGVWEIVDVAGLPGGDFALPSEIKDNSVKVKIGGKVKYIKFNHQGLRDAWLKNNADKSSTMRSILRIFNMYNSFKRAILTQYNPEFAFTNVLRDVQDVIFNAAGVNIEGLTTAVIKNYKKATKASFKATMGNLDPNSEMGKVVDEYLSSGGKISWMNYGEIESEQKKINGMIAKYGDKGGAYYTKQVFKSAIGTLGALNESVEMATRLSVFKALRDFGVPVDKAASISKNLSVNFNKKGTATPLINTVYLFSNAGFQSLYAGMKALKTPRGQKRAAALFGLGMAYPFVQQAIIDMVSGDDDEKDFYNNLISAEEQSNSYIIPIGDYRSVKIPKPYGMLKVFFNAGHELGALSMDGDVGEHTGNMVSTLVSSFDPITGNMSNKYSALSPTSLRPFVEVNFLNRDYNKAPILPDSYGVEESDYLRYFERTNQIYKDVAKNVYWNAGLDVSPETLEYLVNDATGGVITTMFKGIELGQVALKGTEVNPNRIPFYSKFVVDMKAQEFRYTKDFWEVYNDSKKKDIGVIKLDNAIKYAKEGNAIRKSKGEPEIVKDLDKKIREIKKNQKEVKLQKEQREDYKKPKERK